MIHSITENDLNLSEGTKVPVISYPIETLLQVCEFKVDDPRVKDDNFKIKTAFPRFETMRLFYLGKRTYYEEVVKEMLKEGYRPSNAEESICYGAYGSYFKDLMHILTLGTEAKIFGEAIILQFTFLKDSRAINTAYKNIQYLDYCHFLGTKIT